MVDSNENAVSASETLKAERARICALLDRGDWRDISDSYTEAVDAYFRRAVQESAGGRDLFQRRHHFAFVAVGGYGRRELCLESDVDLLILFNGKVPEAARGLAEETLYPLWNLGLDLGHAVRTVSDCTNLSSLDYEVLTSLMDARFLCGDSPLYLELMDRFENRVLRKKAASYVRWLAERNRSRSLDYGHPMEPDLKDGSGGLRDYHSIMWYGKALFPVRDPRELEFSGILSHWEYQELNRCVKFILGVRNHLHRLSGRRNDRLHFHRQFQMSSLLGYRDREGIAAVERFLGDLHAVMASVKSLYRSFVSAHLPKGKRRGKPAAVGEMPAGIWCEDGNLQFVSAELISREPVVLLKIFERSAATGLTLSIESRRLVREFLHLVDEDLMSQPEAAMLFLRMLTLPDAWGALEQMLETGFLSAFIPEFAAVQDRVQFDAYHKFPVGRHQVETVRMLNTRELKKHVLLLTVFSEIRNPAVLMLAGLFHDLGKTGPDHATAGVKITGKVLDRLGCQGYVSTEVLFLVRHHLLLAETATRRDLGDERVVVRCAQVIGNVERLKMLYLLTWADSTATGPRAWNPWKANLVEELFFKLLHIFERGELAGPDAEDLLEKTRSQVKRRLAGTMEDGAVHEAFEQMPPRYLMAFGAGDICRHLGLYRRFHSLKAEGGGKPVVMDARPNPLDGTWEVVFVAGDRAGLFADLTGVLALNGLNVLSADAYSWGDRTAVDMFRVSRPADKLNPGETWRRVEKDLELVASGNFDFSGKIAGKRSKAFLTPVAVPSRSPRVAVDNDQSDFFTVVEVFADDEQGILHRLAETLFFLHLDIRAARIATHTDQIADVFYVCDLDGGKVEETGRIRSIIRAILEELHPEQE